MKALGHPSRLFIVDELRRLDRCVCELTDMIGADISNVSKDLAIMGEVGLVDYEKRGTQMHCLQNDKGRLGKAQCAED